MKKKIRNMLSMILVLSFILAGCVPQQSGSEKENATQKEEEKSTANAKRDSLVLSMNTDIINLDPQGHSDMYSYMADAQIFDTLIYMDENGDYQLMLAESMEQSEDAMTMTVKIKKGIKFTNGDELKASDIKFSFERGMASPTFGRVSSIAKVDVIDDYTINIVFNSPTAYMEQPISSVFIVNEKEVSAVGGDFGNSINGVIGTGAYKITAWNKGQSIDLTRNENYWQGVAPIKDVSIKIITDQSTAALALEKGEIDYIFSADPLLEKTLKDADNVITVSGVQNSLNFIMMNCGKAPFDNVDLRKAIAYAINRDDIVTVAANGNAEATGYFVLDTMVGQAEGMCAPEQDIEKAREYMKLSGYEDGLTVTFLTMDAETEKIGAAVQGMLAEIGITVELNAMEFGAAIDKIFAGDFLISSTGFTNMINPDHYYKWLKSDSGISMFHYTNSEIDEIMDNGRKELDETKRMELYTRMQEIMRDDQVFIPLYVVKQYLFVNKDLGGIKVFPVMVPHIREMYWK